MTSESRSSSAGFAIGERACLFAPRGSAALGARIGAALGLPLEKLEEREFGGRELKLRPLESVSGRSVYVVQTLFGDAYGSANDRLCALLFMIAAFRDAGAARITACVPYLAYARQDRRAETDDPVGNRYLAQLFESMRLDCLVTLDTHNLAALDNAFRCRTVHLEAASNFVRYFLAQSAGLPMTVVSPDIGGAKRARRFQMLLQSSVQQEVGYAFMDKQRSHDSVSGNLFAGDVAGRHAIILDDLISSGSTVSRAVLACRRAGAARVDVAATHACFTPDALSLLDACKPDSLVVTDSIEMGSRFQLSGIALPQVVEIAPLFADAILRLEAAEVTWQRSSMQTDAASRILEKPSGDRSKNVPNGGR